MIAELTAEHFEPLQGQTFTVAAVEPAQQLRLVEVVRKDKSSRMGGSFSLVWQSGDRTVLPQGIHVMTNAALGDVELFIVPVGQAGGGIQYEAVFA